MAAHTPLQGVAHTQTTPSTLPSHTCTSTLPFPHLPPPRTHTHTLPSPHLQYILRLQPTTQALATAIAAIGQSWRRHRAGHRSRSPIKPGRISRGSWPLQLAGGCYGIRQHVQQLGGERGGHDHTQLAEAAQQAGHLARREGLGARLGVAEDRTHVAGRGGHAQHGQGGQEGDEVAWAVAGQLCVGRLKQGVEPGLRGAEGGGRGGGGRVRRREGPAAAAKEMLLLLLLLHHRYDPPPSHEQAMSKTVCPPYHMTDGEQGSMSTMSQDRR